ncbi:hypothetical protein V6V47_08900 [Micromonospora sp. CPCC 205539]|uniref:hypothetical protein n=1 Tax=Micromonospora sp. CPCC 205539 TaxID=3122408 RepID=UPI002FF1FBDE
MRAPVRPSRTRGYTDAYLVTIIFSRHVQGSENSTQRLIVKVQGRETSEPARHERALRSNRSFAARHLVRQPFARQDVDEDRIMTFQEVAHDGGPVTTMNDIDEEFLVQAFTVVMDRVLNDWNQTPADAGRIDRPVGITTVGAYLRGELAVADALDELPRRVAHAGLLDQSSDWMIIDGVVVPNPLRLLDPESPFAGITINYIQGYAHGDLHGANIIIPLDGAPRPDAFRLVDLSAFEREAPLSRDLVGLLLTTVLRHVALRLATEGSGLSATQAEALLHKLLHPVVSQPSPALPRLLDQLVNAAHWLGLSVAEGAWRLEWRTQYRLSLISQALICTTFDNLCDSGRRWCFRLAAEAYREEFFPSTMGPAPDGLPVLPRLNAP